MFSILFILMTFIPRSANKIQQMTVIEKRAMGGSSVIMKGKEPWDYDMFG